MVEAKNNNLNLDQPPFLPNESKDINQNALV